MSQGPNSSKNLLESEDVLAAVEEKRSALERVAQSEYPLAEHAKAILKLANTDS